MRDHRGICIVTASSLAADCCECFSCTMDIVYIYNIDIVSKAAPIGRRS